MLNSNEKMQLVKMLLTSEKQQECISVERKKQIVIAQRGWVFLGDVRKEKENFVIANASIVRSWGTTKGLGELATKGPIKDKTILDPCPDIIIHELSIVARINCEF